MTYNYTDVMFSVVLLVHVSANSSSNMLKGKVKFTYFQLSLPPSCNKTELWFKLLHNRYYKESHNNQRFLV
jgi:hypothetical protein